MAAKRTPAGDSGPASNEATNARQSRAASLRRSIAALGTDAAGPMSPRDFTEGATLPLAQRTTYSGPGLSVAWDWAADGSPVVVLRLDGVRHQIAAGSAQDARTAAESMARALETAGAEPAAALASWLGRGGLAVPGSDLRLRLPRAATEALKRLR